MRKVIQLAVGGLDDNFSYIIHDSSTRDTAIVDPCGDTRLILAALNELRDMKPKYILITHAHNDHISGLAAIRKPFRAPVAAHEDSACHPDIELSHRQQLTFGNSYIECLHSPGHSSDSVIFHLEDDLAIFTGDTLFIDWCGYCVAEQMFATICDVILPLADSNIVYSGHNYGRVPYASLGEEKHSNPYLCCRNLKEFKEKLKKL